jgi:thiol:disulfide interchange protein DsbA
MKHLLAILTAAALLALAPLAAGHPEAGVNFKVLDTPQPTTVPSGKTEVIEFFWYACPHCFAFEPYLEHWQSHKPENAILVRIPVVNGFRWGKVMAHAFYTEKALGVLDKLHDAIFNEIHKKRHLLKTKDDFKQFFEAHGIKGKQFDNAWDSFSVAMNLKRAAKAQKAYHVMGVPMIAVAGRYTATTHRGQGVEALPDIINYLIQKSAK